MSLPRSFYLTLCALVLAALPAKAQDASDTIIAGQPMVLSILACPTRHAIQLERIRLMKTGFPRDFGEPANGCEKVIAKMQVSPPVGQLIVAQDDRNDVFSFVRASYVDEGGVRQNPYAIVFGKVTHFYVPYSTHEEA